jgi:hypothetical protein
VLKILYFALAQSIAALCTTARAHHRTAAPRHCTHTLNFYTSLSYM